MGLIDLAVQLGTNAGATHLAANHESGNLRVPLYKGARDSVLTDARLAAGVGLGIVEMLIPDKHGVSKAITRDLAYGSLHSLVATERVRAVAVKRATAAGGQWGTQAGGKAAPAQLPAPGATPQNPIPVRTVQKVSGAYGAA